MAQINKPTDYFNTVLWTGDGTDDRSITGVGFKPDWVWYKERSNVGDQTVHDIVRGAGERLFPNGTSAESLDANSLQAFESDGFQIGTNSDVNGNTETYVAWNWLADNTSGSSNTDGSITSTVSANTTSGFSIVSYTGTGANATVGHGLGSKPKFIIIKSRDKVDNWHCYNESIGATKVIWLDLTSAPASTSTFMQDTEPTSSVFSLGTNTAVNTSGFDHIAYCFSEVKSFSKFGQYTGNGNTDGTFVYTGFKPAFLLFKKSSATENWYITDNKREPFNDDAMSILYPNLSNSEGNLSDEIDLLSNGFKMRGTNSAHNTSGATYIYMAFAESPLVGTNNTPATAR